MKGKDLHPRLLYPTKLLFGMEGQIKCFPDKIKSKEFIITKPLLYEMVKGLRLSKKKKIKNMSSKITTNAQLSTTKPKKKNTKTKQTKQTTRTGTESQKWKSHGKLSAGRGSRKSGEKSIFLFIIRNIIGRYKIDGGRLRIV